MSDAQKRINRHTRYKQSNVFLLHSTLSKIAVLIVYFRNYAKCITIF